MSPKDDKSASKVRSKFAFLFNCIAELYSLLNGERPDTKAESLRLVVKEMHDDEQIDDYIFSNLIGAFDLYPTMIQSKVWEAYKIDPQAERERHKRIIVSLDAIIGDVCALITDKVKEREIHDRESLLASLLLK